MSLLSHKLCGLVVMGFYAYSIKDLLKKKTKKMLFFTNPPRGAPTHLGVRARSEGLEAQAEVKELRAGHAVSTRCL